MSNPTNLQHPPKPAGVGLTRDNQPAVDGIVPPPHDPASADVPPAASHTDRPPASRIQGDTSGYASSASDVRANGRGGVAAEGYVNRDVSGSDARGVTAGATAAEPGLANLLKTLRDEVLHLVRQEVNLAKTEASEKASFFGTQIGKIAAGGAVLLLGGLLLLVAASILLGALLSLFMPQTLAIGLGFLLVGGVIALIGFSLYGSAKREMAREPLTLERTFRSLQNDKDFASAKAEEASLAARRAVGR